MKTKFLFTIVAALIITNASAQVTFQKAISFGYGKSIQQTADSGYIITGFYAANGQWDSYLLKTDVDGNMLWVKNFGGSNMQQLNSVEQTSDGGYIIAGATGAVGGGYNGYNVFLIRTDGNGDTLWTKSYGGALGDIGNSVKQTPDGGFIIAGNTNSFGAGNQDIYLIKTNANGDTSWTKTMGLNSYDKANEIIITNNGEYILTGSVYYNSIENTFAAKMDSIGDTLWTRIYNIGSFFSGTNGKSIIETQDSAFVVIGTSESSSFGGNFVIIKINNSGDTLWTKNYASFSDDIAFSSIKQTLDGGYIIAGNVSDFSSNANWVLIKTNQLGDTLRTKSYGSFGSYSTLSEVEQSNDGGYILFGSTYSFGGVSLMIKTDSTGNTTCNENNTAVYYTNYVTSVYSGVTLNSGGGIVSGTSTIVSTPNITFSNPCLPIPDICVVSVDSATQKNIIIWEKEIDTTYVSSYNVYKETTTSNVYALIGNVSNSSLSVFIDTSSNPAQKADRYRIASVDSQGIVSYTKSNAHKTIHLSVNLGNPPQINLIWDDYEGFIVTQYKIWRGNASGMTLIALIQGSLYSYTDLNPPVNDTIYLIEALHPTGCNPTAKNNSYLSTKSNFVIVSKPSGIIEIGDNSTIVVYPNPTTGMIAVSNSRGFINSIEIYNLLGEKIYAKPNFKQQAKIDLSNFPKGIYFIKIYDGEKNHAEKIIIQ